MSEMWHVPSYVYVLVGDIERYLWTLLEQYSVFLPLPTKIWRSPLSVLAG